MISVAILAVLGGGPFVIDGRDDFAIVDAGGPAVIAGGAFATVGPVPPI
jgi:hypothetical protein